MQIYNIKLAPDAILTQYCPSGHCCMWQHAGQKYEI